jgi:hypothetical protein
MKLLLFIGTLILLISQISSQKVITCVIIVPVDDYPGCRFSVKIAQSESVTIEMYPSNSDAEKIENVQFKSSSVYTIPPEIFTKFPNLKSLVAANQDIQEIRAETFVNAKNLIELDLHVNGISELRPDTFKGE